MSYMAGMLADMTVHEKHDLLVVALWVLVVIPIWAEVFLYLAYRVAAATEPHIPNDVLRVGLGLAAISAVMGGLFGLGFGALTAIGQAHHELWIVSVGNAVLFLLPGVAFITAPGLIILRRGFLPLNRRRERDQLGPSAWCHEVRRLQLEPYITTHEKQRACCYAARLSASAEGNRRDLAQIRDNLRGFGVFLHLYFGDKDYRIRNNVRLGAVVCFGIAVTVVTGAVWLLAGTWFSARVIAPFVSGEILLWLVLRWRYERVRLNHIAEARDSAASEIGHLTEKKLRLNPETLARPTEYTAMRARTFRTATGILCGRVSLSRRSRLRKSGSL